MTNEYIEREALRDELLNISIDTSNLYNCGILEGLDRATKRLNEQPAADVAPVRHGRWERTADGAALCTACKRKMSPSQYGYAFCGLCGAKMDLSVECKQDGERKEGAD